MEKWLPARFYSNRIITHFILCTFVCVQNNMCAIHTRIFNLKKTTNLLKISPRKRFLGKHTHTDISCGCGGGAVGDVWVYVSTLFLLCEVFGFGHEICSKPREVSTHSTTQYSSFAFICMMTTRTTTTTILMFIRRD